MPHQLAAARDNHITEVSPLAGLTNLKMLFLNSNQITDVSPLSGLTNLEVLVIDGNQATNVASLSGLTKLHIALRPSVVLKRVSED